jgi:hypothetical protein
MQFYRYNIDTPASEMVTITVTSGYGSPGSIQFNDSGSRGFTTNNNKVDTSVVGGLWELSFGATNADHTSRPAGANDRGATGCVVHKNRAYVGANSPPYEVLIFDLGNNYEEITQLPAISLTNAAGRFWGTHPLHNYIATGSTSANCVAVIDTDTGTLVKTMTHPTGAGVPVALSKNSGKVYTAKTAIINRFDVDSGVVDLQWTAPTGANFNTLTSTYDAETGRAFLYACSRGSDSSIYVFDDSGADPELVDVIAMPGRSPMGLVPYDGTDWAFVLSAKDNADLVYIGPDPNPTRTNAIAIPWEVVPPHDPYPELPEQPAEEPELLPDPEPIEDDI